ncbi:KUP system potassium uptake protein [Rhodopseudomonas faecalis]|uniref:Probable potassium transport system protein Kup n=1 Tax=Rhodopseudomonas faecalis TaxID=99655 RepID=A0A318TPM3_9BRAD|nr:potassium transporter Kup [Rhodopseudomonas faecalis]PYF03865.1 KUP system potassium uptake protein [Rhodopseudomonas faecalis]TAH68975.1 MAG: potassium transporter Kup [Rhodopseudomonas palustris]
MSDAISAPAAIHTKRPTSLATLTLGSIGVVYGDLGTSPLYALKESLAAASAGGALTQPMVLGVVSLVLWTLFVIVTLKYVLLIMRADNHGEGGILTLMALLQGVMRRRFTAISVLGMAGAAMFYGDAMITPAVSVLSAVEGLKLATPAFEPYIMPLSMAILIGLFVVQRWGTAAVAAWFGPVMLVWFCVIGIGGLMNLIGDLSILAALNPLLGIEFLLNHGYAGMVALGAVFLTVTGAEALYADMGHFGRKPIKLAWMSIIFPALVLCYLGQGAMLLSSPDKAENPFFHLFPEWALLPMVGLAMLATTIASQSVISGAFSLTRQAIQLGLLPRMEIRRTSETEKGQIYLPRANWLLLIAVLYLVFAFKSSSALAAAFGIAVTGTMVITSIMAFLVMRTCWKWPLLVSALVIAPFLAVDTIFLSANLLKVFEGGWIPLAMGTALMVIMITWQRGSKIVAQKSVRDETDLDDFIRSISTSSSAVRVRGVAVFLTANPNSTPTSLMHNLKHNKVLHEHNVILRVVTEDVPRVPNSGRASVEVVNDRFTRIVLRFGYMETPDVPAALRQCAAGGFAYNAMNSSFFLSRRVIRAGRPSDMPRWQSWLFVNMAKWADDASLYFQIPSGRAVEIGMQINV